MNTIYVNTVEAYLKAIRDISYGTNAKYIYRGQKDFKDSVYCGTARRYLNSGYKKEINNSVIVKYHRRLLEKAKKIGLNFRDGHEIKDAEIIADLQHHGCATMFIDFTRDPLVALYFATESSSRHLTDIGVVYVLDITDVFRFKEFDNKELTNDSFLSTLSDEKEYYLFWEPTHLNKRIPAQHSIFIFGKAQVLQNVIHTRIIINKDDSISNDLEKKDINKNPIKESIQKELQRIHDINNIVLFNDLPGFSYANNQYSKIDGLVNPEQILHEGISYYQSGDFISAIDNFSETIEMLEYQKDQQGNKGLLSRAYYDRGLSKYRIGESKKHNSYYEHALQDFDSAIQLNNKYSKAYQARGLTNYKLNKLNKALEDYNKSIEIDPNDSEAYSNRGNANCSLGEYKKAIEDFNKAIELRDDKYAYYSNRGNAKLYNKQYDEALEDYEKALSFEIKDPILFQNIGYVLLFIGKSENSSKSILEDSIKYSSESITYSKNKNDVIKDKNEDINENFSPYLNRSIAYAELGEIDKSLKDYEKVKNIKNKDKYKDILEELEKCFDPNGNLKPNWREQIITK